MHRSYGARDEWTDITPRCTLTLPHCCYNKNISGAVTISHHKIIPIRIPRVVRWDLVSTRAVCNSAGQTLLTFELPQSRIGHSNARSAMDFSNAGTLTQQRITIWQIPRVVRWDQPSTRTVYNSAHQVRVTFELPQSRIHH